VAEKASAAAAKERSFRLCSLVSEASGEDPIGSAWATDHYLLVELALPWGPNVLEGKQVPAGFGDLILEAWDQGARWGLIGIAPDDVYSVPGMTRVIDFRLPAAPFRRFERDEYLFPPEALVPSLRVLSKAAKPLELNAFRQPPPDTRDLLVCTHGAVDACCAKFGYPIFRHLRRLAADAPAPVRVWRCTHFGGHRFAATLLDMPEGRYWGRLTPEHLTHLMHRDVPAANLRGCYRGWAALPHPLQQIAEGEVFVRGDWTWTECTVTPSDPPPLNAIEASISFAYDHPHRGERGEIAVDVIPDGTRPTQESSSDLTLIAAPQYRTLVRHFAPVNGLLGGDTARR
jgi:hypothetical protein